MIQSGAKFYDGIEVRAQKPVDVRTIVESKEDLYKLSSWPHDEYIEGMGGQYAVAENGNKYVVYMKEGMVVTVTGTKDNPIHDLYILTDITKILGEKIEDENGNPIGWDYYAGWKHYTGGSGSNESVNINGNIDGGRADEFYTPSQIIKGGNCNSQGEAIDLDIHWEFGLLENISPEDYNHKENYNLELYYMLPDHLRSESELYMYIYKHINGENILIKKDNRGKIGLIIIPFNELEKYDIDEGDFIQLGFDIMKDGVVTGNIENTEITQIPIWEPEKNE